MSDAAAQVTWAQVAAWRMARHGLVERAVAADALDVVSRICGLHAQVMSSAVRSLRARVDGLEPDAVPRALWDDGTLVKTWAMRGTLHLLPVAELPRWLAALSTFDHYLKPAWTRASGLRPDEVVRFCEHVMTALAGGPLTRKELADAVEEMEPGWGELARGSWGSVLKVVAFRGGLCFGPDRERNVTFRLPPVAAGADGDAAVSEIVLRYLSVYGPATRADLARWWGWQPAAAGRRLKALGDAVVAVDVEGVASWARAADVAALQAAQPAGAIAAVPAFDPYVAGAPREPSGVFPPERRDAIYRAAGWLTPVVLRDGVIVATWDAARDGTIALEPFGRLAAADRRAAIESATRLLGG